MNQQIPATADMMARIHELGPTLREHAAEADRVFSMLMGEDVGPRREFIESNATYANIDA